MYLISLYFDTTTEKNMRKLMEQAASTSGNTFMLDGNIPPHITVLAFETLDEDRAVLMRDRWRLLLVRWLSSLYHVRVLLQG